MTNTMKPGAGFFLLVLLVLFTGCGGETVLHPVTGRVTIGGNAHERLLVYFRPINKPAGASTLGVGETSSRGDLTLRSTAGDGLASGSYRVSFSCSFMKGVTEEIASPTTEKGDGRGMQMQTGTVERTRTEIVERVPAPYSDPEASPVTFEIRAGQTNFFQFDVPEAVQNP